MSAVTDPMQMETYSTPEQIAEVVYEAATDGGRKTPVTGVGCAKATAREKIVETDPPLTRRAVSGYGWFRKSLSELVELTGIEPVTS